MSLTKLSVVNATLTDDNNETIDIFDASITSNETSWGWSASITIDDVNKWRALLPKTTSYHNVTLTIHGATDEAFNFIVEGGDYSISRSGYSYRIVCRSLTAILDSPHSEQYSEVYYGMTAKQIVEGICATHNIAVLWQTVNWNIPKYEVVDKLPITVISDLANAVGAVVQTVQGGTQLIIRPLWPVSLNNITSYDHVLTSDNDLESVSYNWDKRDLYNKIDVSNVGSVDRLSVSFESEGDGNVITLKAYVVPFQDIDLQDSAEGYLESVYQGVHEEEHEELIEIIDGTGRTSKPFYQRLRKTYYRADLGEMVTTESGEITADIAGETLVEFLYISKYHQWQITLQDESSQVYVLEDEQ